MGSHSSAACTNPWVTVKAIQDLATTDIRQALPTTAPIARCQRAAGEARFPHASAQLGISTTQPSKTLVSSRPAQSGQFNDSWVFCSLGSTAGHTADKRPSEHSLWRVNPDHPVRRSHIIDDGLRQGMARAVERAPCDQRATGWVLRGCSAAAVLSGMSRHTLTYTCADDVRKRHRLARSGIGRHGEQLALNQRVRGSSPWRRTIRKRRPPAGSVDQVDLVGGRC
jgi:hypothetical protein